MNKHAIREKYEFKDYLDHNGIDDIQSYFNHSVDEYNKRTVPYKKVGLVKLRTTEFPKNTLRKIQRFKLNTTID